MKHLYTLVLLLAIVVNVQSQTSNVEELFAERVEVYFEFEVEHPSNLAEVARIVSLDHGNWSKVARAYANERQFKAFLELDLSYTILPPPSTLHTPKMMDVQEYRAKGAVCLEEWNAYPTYEAYEEMMIDFEAKYRSICRIEEFGVLPSGRRLLAAVISDNIDVKEAEPQFLYTSSMHGDETAGFPMMLQLIDHLLCEYGNNDEITNLVDNMEIWINPLANPDGTYTNNNNTVFGATRSNASGYDLNRNYPDPVIGDVPFNQRPMQTETGLFVDLAEANNFVVAANFHGGTEVVNYPWDTKVARHPDDSWFECISLDYVELVHENSPNHYFDEFGNGVTNGYDWYEVNGGRQDFMNHFHNCREVTIELSDDKLLNANDIESHWDYNRAALLELMERALQGFQGVVTDIITGEPIEAKVFVQEHDFDNSEVYTNEMGYYARPIDVGTYDLLFTAEGYLDVEYKGMNISKKHQIIRLDVTMLPDDAVNIEELVAKTGFLLYPNPANDWVSLQLEEKADLVQIFDIAGRIIFEADSLEEELTLDLSEWDSGVYWVKVLGRDWSGSQKLVVN